ncbi:MAG: phosphate-starvation-inducible E-like protein [Desulfuromonadales bacterium]|nr:MAG: phosphate-starvation-inducible E-like protein [Desulfuromonadales bacterium]
MNNFIDKVETFIVWALVLMLLLAVLLGTLGLGRTLVEIIIDSPPYLLIEPKKLFQSFGLFLICLIGLELLKLLKFHLSHHFVKPELVVEVAIIALCNKVVTLDLKETDHLSLIGLAAMIFALAAGYYVFSRYRWPEDGQ